MPQTSYTGTPAAAVAGMFGDANPEHIMSRAVATAAGVAAGRFVAYSSSTECKALAAATDVTPGGVLLGVTIKQFWTRESGSPDYPQRSMASILRRGRVWMVCAGAIAITDPLFIVHTGANAGLPSALDDATTTPIDGSAFKCIIPAGDGLLGLFEVNLP
jgi:hypothetical protein